MVFLKYLFLLTVLSGIAILMLISNCLIFHVFQGILLGVEVNWYGSKTGGRFGPQLMVFLGQIPDSFR